MIYDSPLWFEDIDKVTQIIPEISELAGKSVLITGATGLICSAVVDVFIRYNETHPVPIIIIAAGRRREKIKNRFGPFCDKAYFKYIQYDALSSKNNIYISADYIIHGASNANPSAIMKEPVETMLSNFTGMLYLLQYAKNNRTERVLYISSSEIYGCKESGDPFREGEYGYIDLLNPRNSYSVGKRATETLCASYSSEYGVETVIVRPGHIYGPTASPSDSRVSSAWAYMAAQGKDIVMKSDGSQLRSYCFCLDCASAIIKVLLQGINMFAYNISNINSIISIRKMAEMLSREGNVRLIHENASIVERKGFNPMMNSSLDSTNLQALGWNGCFDAQIGMRHTVRILRDVLSNGGKRI